MTFINFLHLRRKSWLNQTENSILMEIISSYTWSIEFFGDAIIYPSFFQTAFRKKTTSGKFWCWFALDRSPVYLKIFHIWIGGFFPLFSRYLGIVGLIMNCIGGGPGAGIEAWKINSPILKSRQWTLIGLMAPLWAAASISLIDYIPEWTMQSACSTPLRFL